MNRIDVALDVAPANGKPQRVVAALTPSGEYTDTFDPNSERSRSKFITRVAERYSKPAEDFDFLHEAIIEAAAAAGMKSNGEQRPRRKPNTTAPNKASELTDLGNAERFAREHGDTVRYLHRWQKWLVWNGRRWLVDETGEVVRLAKQTVRKIYSEAAETENASEQADIVKWARTSQTSGRIDAMLKLAQSEQPIPASYSTLDGDPWLLNCENGTVDLATGELKPHDKSQLITRTTGVEYPEEPGIDAVLWSEFLETIFGGDLEVLSFVQRLFGSALVGEVSEQILPILFGCGANGKSVFIETVMSAMGDFAMKAPPGLLIAQRGESHPTQLADLFGRRLVVVAETAEGQRLDERLVKELTGGDTIRARRMREDFWEFPPSHLAAMVTNHRPVVRGVDHGIWRRLRLVSFAVTIPDDQQDRSLSRKLRDELPAILRWLVEGCLAWQRDGLNAPAEVMAATQEYRSESDSLNQWFDERCRFEATGETKVSIAFANYKQWAESNGERPLGRRRFSDRVSTKCTKVKRSAGIYFCGFSLVSAT